MAAGVTAPHAVGTLEHGAVAQRRLVLLLARVKWTLWRRAFRKNVGKVIATVFGALYGLGGLALLTVGLGSAALLLDGASPGAFAQLLRALGVAVVLVWLLVPVFAFGLDDTLDPRRFAALPRSARELQAGLLVAAAISLPSLFTVLGVLIATGCEVLWLVTSGVPDGMHLVAALVLLVPANALGLVLCLLLPRAILAQSATRATSRRLREVWGVVGMLAMLGALYGISLLSAGASEDGALAGIGLARILAAVDAVTWTPLGAAFSAPLDVAEGHVVAGAVRLLVAVVAVALVWLWWRRSIRLALRSALTGDAPSGQTKVSALVPRVARPNALGASWGRSLRYWRRDARYLAAIGVLPVMLVFFTAMGALSPYQRPFALAMTVFVVGLSSVSICNELGFDGPSGWVNITAGAPARAVLGGRILALATVTVPFAILAAIIVPLVLGEGRLIPVVLLGSLGAMMGAWGLSCLIAVTLPYPASPPGTNPLKDRSASSANALIASFAAVLGMWVPQLPAIALIAAGLALGSPVLQVIGGVVSVLCGAVALWLCLRGACRILDRRYVDLFQRVRDYV